MEPHTTAEFEFSFTSLDEWMAWAGENTWVFDPRIADAIGQRIVSNGFKEPITGRSVHSGNITHCGTNWREGLISDGLNSRMRAVLALIEKQFDRRADLDLAIYAAEAITPLALKLRGRFARFTGSEYMPDLHHRQRLFPVMHQDLTALTFPNDSLDLVTTNEVLEHVAELDVVLHELCRVLVPGGWHIGTVPFRLMDQDSDKRARLVDGKVVHLKAPEYHGNPLAPEAGSLVFETPGWDIVKRALHAGFSKVQMRFTASEQCGVLAEHTGLFVFCAQK